MFYYHFKDKYDLVAWMFCTDAYGKDITSITSAAAGMNYSSIAFIALILRSQMLKALSELMSKEGFTLRKIFSELDKAKLIISAASLSGSRLLNPPTRLQKDILAALGLPQDCFSSMLV